ncbi:MAG: radical SAM protein, partial [Actinobacteria bacterium]
LAPRVLGLTAVTMTVHAAAETAKLVSERLPGIRTVLGGVHASSCPEATYDAFPWFDAIALGEADETLPELLAAVCDGRPLTEVPGLLLREPDGALRHTGDRALITELDSLPMPAFDLLGDFAHRYRPAAHSYQRLPATSLISSRGCPGRCTFCDRSVSGSRVRTYSASYLVSAVERLRDEYGIREVVFHDDNFVAARTRLREFCELMVERRVGVTWSCTGRVDMVDAESLRAMRRAGCWRISYGVESGSQTILDSLCKGTTLEGIRRTLEMTAEARIKSHGYFMIGVPGETEATLKETLDFLLELPLADFHMTVWSPHPGTELTRRITAEGWADSPEHWPQLNDWTPVYVPEGLTAERLLEVQREAFRRFYRRPRVIA